MYPIGNNYEILMGSNKVEKPQVKREKSDLTKQILKLLRPIPKNQQPVIMRRGPRLHKYEKDFESLLLVSKKARKQITQEEKDRELMPPPASHLSFQKSGIPLPVMLSPKKSGIPLPAMSSFSRNRGSSTTQFRAPPPTPAKKRLTNEHLKIPAVKASSEIHKIGKIEINGQKKDLTLFSDKGCFKSVFSFKADPLPESLEYLDLATENPFSEYLVKCYKKHLVETKPRSLQGYLERADKAHKVIKSLGLPIAKHNDFLKEKKYLVEKIKGEVPKEVTHSILEQVKEFYTKAVRYNKNNPNKQLAFDFSKQNFGMKGKTLCLLDLMEETLYDNQPSLHMAQTLCSWTGKDRKTFNYLMSEIKEIDPDAYEDYERKFSSYEKGYL